MTACCPLSGLLTPRGCNSRGALFQVMLSVPPWKPREMYFPGSSNLFWRKPLKVLHEIHPHSRREACG